MHRRLTAGRSKHGFGTMAEDRDLLNADLEVCSNCPKHLVQVMIGEVVAHAHKNEDRKLTGKANPTTACNVALICDMCKSELS